MNSLPLHDSVNTIFVVAELSTSSDIKQIKYVWVESSNLITTLVHNFEDINDHGMSGQKNVILQMKTTLQSGNMSMTSLASKCLRRAIIHLRINK